MDLTTVIYIEDQEDWLMLHRVKKEKDINQNKWLGVGGKFEFGEAPLACAKREVLEETGQELLHPQFRGFVTFHYENHPPRLIMVYTGKIASREVDTNDEGVLKWIPKTEVLDLDLWEGDRLFIKEILADNAPFDFSFYYNEKRELINVKNNI